MNQNVIINVVFVAVALIIAIFLGQWVVTAPKEVGIGLAVVVAAVTFFVMKQHVWMLVPAFMTLSISFPWIPGGFSPVELACIYVIVCTFFLLLTRKITLRIQMTAIEWMALLVILMLLQAFIRNPAGIRLMHSDYVGGRAYFVMTVFIFSAYILATTRTNHARISKLFKWSILGYLGSFGINAIAQISGALAVYTGALFGVYGEYGGPLGQDMDNSNADTSKAGRSAAATIWARASSRCLSAFRNPLTALWHPFWGIILLSALLGAGMSGFRNVIASTCLTFVFGVYYWGRGKAVFAGCLLGIVAYLLINILNMMMPLPANIQRSLSFLPGTWEERYVEDAGASTDWRIEMWEEALFTDRYIENKMLGDGLGIRRSDFSHMMAISTSRVITDEMSQERAMLAGDFHSGPITTIRVMGYSGLLVLITAMLLVAIRAHKLIIYSRKKPYFREVIFFCLPLVWFPLFFVFIFGSFKASIPTFFLQVGLLRLLEINLKGREEANEINSELAR